MPLITRIIRDGETILPRSTFEWVSMAIAATIDSEQATEFTTELLQSLIDQGWKHPDALSLSETFINVLSLSGYNFLSLTPLNDGPYTLKLGYTFTESASQAQLLLMSGDILSAYRN